MEKQIILTDNGIEIKGFNTIEVLGLLRYYEKIVWLKMAKTKAKQRIKQHK